MNNLISYRQTKLKLVFLIIIFVFAPYYIVNFSKKDISSYSNEIFLNISSVSPILINGNHELSIIASSGNGSKYSPYIVKDLIAFGNGSIFGIYFNNTNQYFVLNNCSVTGTDIGIYLNNASNGLIKSSRCFDNKKYGIYFKHSINNNIDRSSISLSEIGIFFFKSYNCSANYCYISTNSIGGIEFVNSSFNKISKNNIYYNNNSAISLNFSDKNIINNNSIDNHKIAILLNTSNYNDVKFNKGSGNMENIVEINCIGNIFQGNFQPDKEPRIVDFTSILIFGIPIIIVISFIIKLLKHYKFYFFKKGKPES